MAEPKLSNKDSHVYRDNLANDLQDMLKKWSNEKGLYAVSTASLMQELLIYCTNRDIKVFMDGYQKGVKRERVNSNTSDSNNKLHSRPDNTQPVL